MKKSIVKKIFIFFMAFLPLQYAAVGIIDTIKSEPWPAFVLPAFKNADSNKILLQPAFTVDTKSGSYTLNNQTIFKELNHSQRLTFIETQFFDSLQIKNFNSQTRRWVRNQLRGLMPDSLEPVALHIRWDQKSLNNPDRSGAGDATTPTANRDLEIKFNE